MCETCAYFVFDEQLQEYVCDAYMDQDDVERFSQSGNKTCPFWRNGDEYAVVRHQI